MPAASPYFRRTLGRPKYPGLWHRCTGAWCPSVMGPTGATLYDLSHHANHGTLTGYTLASAYVVSYGKYSLSGTGSQYVTGFHNPIAPTAQNDRTVSIWFRTASATRQGLIGMRDTTPLDRGWFLGILNSTQVAVAIIGFGVVSATVTYADSQWHNLAYIHQGSSLTLLFDGAVVATSSLFPGTSGDNFTGVIAAEDDTFSSPLNGQWDDARVYDRALPLSAVRSLASRRGIAYESLNPSPADVQRPNLLDLRRRAVVC